MPETWPTPFHYHADAELGAALRAALATVPKQYAQSHLIVWHDPVGVSIDAELSVIENEATARLAALLASTPEQEEGT